MSALTIQLPDDLHKRIKALAADRGVSVNHLLEELSIRAVTEHDVAIRFRAAVVRGQSLDLDGLMDQLDAHFKTDSRPA